MDYIGMTMADSLLQSRMSNSLVISNKNFESALP
jgi:hypothetical protein